MRSVRRQGSVEPARSIRRQGTMNMGNYEGGSGNIFEEYMINMEMNHPPDKERPRANLYNVVKKLRENTVSFQLPAQPGLGLQPRAIVCNSRSPLLFCSSDWVQADPDRG